MITERLVVGHVDLQRRNGNIAFVHGHAVGAVVFGEAEIVAADPIVFLAARVDALDDILAVMALALAGEAPAFDSLLLKRRNVDVQQHCSRHALMLYALDQRRGKIGGNFEVKALEAH